MRGFHHTASTGGKNGDALPAEQCRCEDESIDELAEYLGSGAAVAALTKRQASAVYPPADCCLVRTVNSCLKEGAVSR